MVLSPNLKISFIILCFIHIKEPISHKVHMQILKLEIVMFHMLQKVQAVSFRRTAYTKHTVQYHISMCITCHLYVQKF